MSSRIFVIEDEGHAEWVGRYRSLPDAMAELAKRAALGWDQDVNRPPCTGWETCSRDYVIVEFDSSVEPWVELSRRLALKVDKDGTRWVPPFGEDLAG